MNGSLRTLGVWLGLAWLGVAGCGEGGGGDRGPQGVEPAGIELTTDRSLIFTEAGQTAVVAAIVVDDSGNKVNDAPVTWSSSDPDAVEVDEQGNVTAVTSLGSAVLTAEYQGLRNLVTAVVVVLRPETTLVPTEDVISVNADRTEIELTRSPTYEGLAMGDIVVNGNANGFLSRVMSVETRSASVLLHVGEASVVDALEELDLRAMSPEQTFSEEVVPDNGGGSESVPGTKALSLVFECKFDTMLVNVGLEGLNVTPTFGLHHEIIHRIRRGTVDHLEVALVGTIDIEAMLGAVKLAGGLKGKIECAADLKQIPFLPVPLFGPLLMSGVATPNLGVGLEVQYTGLEYTINGQKLRTGVRLRVGFQYDAANGYSTIKEQEITTNEVAPLKTKGVTKNSVTAKVEPFVGLKFGIGVLLGPLLLGSADIVGTKIFGGFELKLAEPLELEAPMYAGPVWSVYVGLDGDLNPLRENIGLLGGALGKLGLKELHELVGVDLKLFELKKPLLESPDPTITPNPKVLNAGSIAQLAIQAPTAEVGTLVEAWAFPAGGGEGQQIGSDALDGQGSSEIEWTPSLTDEGAHELKALLYDDIFGEIGLPYATHAQPKPGRTVEVGLGQIAISPSSAELFGRTGVPATGSFLVLNPGDEAVELDANAVGSWLTITQNAMGSVPSGGELKVDFEATCPQPEGTFDAMITLDFRDGDGNPLEGDDVPSSFAVNLTCSDVCAIENLPSLSLSGSISFHWHASGSLDTPSGPVLRNATHDVSLGFIDTPVFPRGVSTVNGMASMSHRAESVDSTTIWDGSGPAVDHMGNPPSQVAFLLDAVNCTYGLLIDVFVDGRVTTNGEAQDQRLLVVEARVLDRPIPPNLRFRASAALPIIGGPEAEYFDPGTPGTFLKNFYSGDPPAGTLRWDFSPRD